ncbi:MAG: sodium:proton antiporter [Oscillospiraceae bacterium]|jgi:multicomponent Na+:H+ antiporter subunit F|nr:sodium:proton antiporter [Oscillospiraceae bacterium]
MEKTILTLAIAVLALLMLCLMYRVVKGPRFTDRILAVNAINTMITAIICLLSRYLGVAYLLDVALIYALLSFVGGTLLMRLLAAEKEEEDEA